MELEVYFRFFLALGFVLALIATVAWLARRYGPGGRASPNKGRGRRLKVIEALPLDARHRLVLVRRDGAEHLLLLGAGGPLVVEGGIAGAGAAPIGHAAGTTSRLEGSV